MFLAIPLLGLSNLTLKGDHSGLLFLYDEKINVNTQAY